MQNIKPSAQVSGACKPTRQQRRAAERRAKKVTKQNNCGIEHVRENGLMDITMQAASALYRKFGPPPHTLSVVAAHEAGHLTVGLANGGNFKECYVQHECGAWVGYNEVFVPGVHGPNICPALEPERAVKFGTQILGGIAAEHITDQYHPASSIEEMTMAGTIAAGLQQRDPTYTAAGLLDEACKLIRDNRAAFDHARALLEKNKRITIKDIPAIQGLLGGAA